MPQSSIVNATLDPHALAAVKAALATAAQNLPFLVDLTPEQRRTLPKMGARTQPFVAKALAVARANPQMLPVSFDLAKFERSYALWQALAPLATQLVQFNERFGDTLTALGSDLCSDALTTYGYMKTGGEAAALDNVRAEMGQRFVRGKKGASAASQQSAGA